MLQMQNAQTIYCRTLRDLSLVRTGLLRQAISQSE